MSQSNVNAVVGLQLGDEGKTQILDYFAKDSDIAIKYQNGFNSEIVKNEFGSFNLAIVPPTAFNPDMMTILSAGSFIDFDLLSEEMDSIINKTDLDLYSIFIDERAYLVMPYHKIDGKNPINEAKKDILAGTILQAGDLLDEELLVNKIARAERKGYSKTEISELCKKWKGLLGDHIIDTLPIIRDSVDSETPIIVSANESSLYDALFGEENAPYASTLPMTLYSAGIPVQAVDKVIGVAKAYLSTNDNRKLCTKMDDSKLGWFDAVATDYSAYINGATNIALTDISALDSCKKIKVCIGYSINGEYYANFPQQRLLKDRKPIYAEFNGWEEDTRNITSWDELPENCKSYILELEKFMNLPISIIGVGKNIIAR